MCHNLRDRGKCPLEDCELEQDATWNEAEVVGLVDGSVSSGFAGPRPALWEHEDGHLDR